MSTRSWLWRRKSSEKSPGETESSGSISSHSERYSDDQELARAYPNYNTQSPEVTSKSIASSEEVNDGVKKSPATSEEINDSMRSLTEKLSAALLNIKAKEDLVKQHAKVAEEAVSGWEKAENEGVALKQQLEAATQKNSALEDRVGHLDGALKECVRQLRQAREEQEQKIHEAVVKKIREWESAKFELESQLVELQNQVQAAKAEAAVSVDPDLCPQLEAAEKLNSALKLELLARAEDIEIRTLERDLSTQAAESASKQHLESIKKVAKLEAECRRLKAIARKSSLYNDHKSVAASSFYVESLTDSQSDSGERLLAVEADTKKLSSLELNECEPSCSDSWASALIAELDQFKNEKAVGRNFRASSAEIDLMDDFLEMEKLAALPETGSGSRGLELVAVSVRPNDGNNRLNMDLEAMIQRTADLEEKLEKIETEKTELEEKLEKMETVKTELQEKLEEMEEVKTELEEEFEEMEAKKAELEQKLEKMEAEKTELKMALAESQDQLESLERQIEEAKEKLEELQTKLALANELKKAAEVRIEAANAKREVVESHLVGVEAEVRALRSKVGSLEAEVEKERTLSAEIEAKCHKLEDELSRKNNEAELRRAGSSNGELKIKQDKELAVAAGKLAECQKTIAFLGQQLKSLATLEDFLMDSDKPL